MQRLIIDGRPVGEYLPARCSNLHVAKIVALAGELGVSLVS